MHVILTFNITKKNLLLDLRELHFKSLSFVTGGLGSFVARHRRISSSDDVFLTLATVCLGTSDILLPCSCCVMLCCFVC